jgi:tetratricopeptide (TPR) repeat protein
VKVGGPSRFVRDLLALALAGLAVGAVAGCAQSPEAKKQKALERGQQFLKDGKTNEAIIELRSALATDKDMVPALHALGRAYAAKAWAADAIRELGRAQGLRPDSRPIAIDYGRSLVQAGAWKEAEEVARRILGREPKNTSGLYIQAAALLGQGKSEEMQSLLASIPRDASTPEIESVRAEALLRAGKVDDAEQAFRTVLVGDPQGSKPLMGLGRIQMMRNAFKDALGFFEQARKARPEDPEVRLGLAEANAQLGQTKEAIAELESLDLRARSVLVMLALSRYYLAGDRAAEVITMMGPVVERAPKLSLARTLLGHAYLATRRPEQAAVQFDALVRLEPGQAAFKVWLAAALVQQGRGKDALSWLDLVAKDLDKVAIYQGTRANALLLVGRLDDAARAAEMAQRLAPQSPQPYLVLGQIRTQQGQTKAARDLFLKAAELDAGSAPAHLALGRLHAAEKDMTAALKEFDAAVEADPRSLAAVRTKAAALVQQNQTKEAVRFLESAVAREPKNASFHSLLGTVRARDKQADKAAAAFRKAIELDPRAVDPRLGLARLAILQGNDKEAVAQLQAGVKERPDLQMGPFQPPARQSLVRSRTRARSADWSMVARRWLRTT